MELVNGWKILLLRHKNDYLNTRMKLLLQRTHKKNESLIG